MRTNNTGLIEILNRYEGHSVNLDNLGEINYESLDSQECIGEISLDSVHESGHELLHEIIRDI